MSSSSDVAIIGIACRYPGEANSPQAFHDMLIRGEDAWSEVPLSRFDVNAFHHPSKGRQGNTVARGGYFLKEDVSKWDARFFACSPVEARAMDPQQRLLLEVAYESLESAGIPIEAIANTDTGCYVGAFGCDYKTIVGRDIRAKLPYSISGCALTILSNRVSWFFNLRGPSLTLDTACSSSMTALHLACEAITSESNSTRCALVGGTNLLLDPDDFCSLSALGFLSPDSRCFAFDSRANGYARGDGICMLVVKHIDDAIRDGDPIRAVIRGSGINSDGRTAGITLPNGEAQEQLIRRTYQLAGLDFADTQYVEFHGTGTKAGDPMEMGAVTRTIAGKSRSTLYGGSVKTQVGHTEAAAGLAGLVKCVLAMEHGIIPPHLNFSKPNRRLRLSECNVVLPTSPQPWPECMTRRCSVNSFGFGGTNAHVIIDEGRDYLLHRSNNKSVTNGVSLHRPAVHGTLCRDGISAVDGNSTVNGSPAISGTNGSTASNKTESARVFVLSAPDRDTLTRQRQSYAGYLAAKGSNRLLDDLSYTLGKRRSTFQWRHAVTTTSSDDLERRWKDESSQAVSAKPKPRVLFVFTGQGAQWYAMGRELMKYDVYASSIKESAAYLKELGCPWDALDELMATEKSSNVYLPEYSQPLCTILQIALVDLLANLGVHPSAVVGHSSGEIAGAYAANTLAKDDCLRIAYYRGVVSKKAQAQFPGGSMMAVGLSTESVRPYLSESRDLVSIGCVNSTASVTLTGDKGALLALKHTFDTENIFCRLLAVENAYHSMQMRAVSEEYRKCIGEFMPRSPTKPVAYYSTVYGKLICGSQLGPEYWVQNLCKPVEFVAALDDIMYADTGKQWLKSEEMLPSIMLEIGPHSALGGPIKQVKVARGLLQGMEYYSVLSRGSDASHTFAAAIGSLWTHGVAVDLDKLNQPSRSSQRPQVLTDLPLYSWNHSTSYWHETQAMKNINWPEAARHDLLGSLVNSHDKFQPTWQNWLRVSELPWLRDHQVQGDVVFPAAGMICSVIEALQQQSRRSGSQGTISGFELRDITIPEPLIIPTDDSGVETQLRLHPAKQSNSAGWFTFFFSSCSQGNTFVQHMQGLAQIQYSGSTTEIDGGKESREEASQFQNQLQSWLDKDTQLLTKNDCYETSKRQGITYGKTFQGISKVYQDGLESSFEVQIQDVVSQMSDSYESNYVIHPATLDAMLHPILTATAMNSIPTQAWVPTSIDSVQISSSILNAPGTSLHGICTPRLVHPGEMLVNILVGHGAALDSLPRVVIDGLTMTGLGALHNSPQSFEEGNAAKLYSYPVWKLDPHLVRASELRKSADEKYGRDLRMADFCSESWALVNELCRHAIQTLEPNLRSSSLPPHLYKYFNWMQQRCGVVDSIKMPNGGAVDSSASQQKLMNGTGHSEDDPVGTNLTNGISSSGVYSITQKLSAFRQKYPVDGKLLETVFNSLGSIFSDETVPLAVLMADDNLPGLYREAYGLPVNMEIFRDWFDLRANKTPNMRVVEIGAGTASTTLPILQRLSAGVSTPCFSKWVFTDISPGWFEKAQAVLGDWSERVDYKVLDIDQNPLEQGFEAESYDVLLAVNVLHATKDIARTLQHCGQLLKPGGSLVLGEYTNSDDPINFITGILPGWWAAVDGRENGPLLHTSEWESALVHAGFSVPEIILSDNDDEKFYRLCNIVSTKLARNVQTPSKGITIIIPDHTLDLVKDLASLISAALAPLGTDVTISGLSALPVDADRGTVISLLEYGSPIFEEIDENTFQKVQNFLLQCKEVLWVTRSDGPDGASNPNTRMISGLLRTVRSEDTSRRLHELHFARRLSSECLQSACSVICHRIQSLQSPVPGELEEVETMERDGNFFIPRYMPESTMNDSLARDSQLDVAPRTASLLQEGRPLKLAISQPGRLDTLQFIDDSSVSGPLRADEIEVEVQACGLNFLDVMVAMGEIPRSGFGVEAAGIVCKVGIEVEDFVAGDRVLLMAPGVMRTVMRARSSSLHKIPAGMSLDDAVSIPVVYATAYHSLLELARLQQGESVLIHAAAGGLGQALIQIAKMLGAEIYCTVGSEAKKQAIIALGVKPDNIFSSRGLAFEKGIKRVTQGRGVDVIVNSLAGEALRRSWLCLAPYGRFVEVGKMDLMSNNGLEMRPFLTGTTFSGCNLEYMMLNDPLRVANLLSKVMQLFESGVVELVRPITVHDFSNVELAFRELQRGAHIGKLVLRVTAESRVPVLPPKSVDMKLKADGTYVLVGGLGGLGRGQALFMAKHGARHLGFISRSGDASKDAQAVMKTLAEQGVQAKVYAGDITDRTALKEVLDDISKTMPPIRGVIQGAMQLDDSVFHKMSHQQWVAATRPKVQGSWNLHELLPDTLDFFIMLSSLAGIIGSVSQANYAAGNTYQDALAHYRRSNGLPALSINLGIIGGLGYVAEHKDVAARLGQFGLASVNESQFFHLLRCAIAGTADNQSRLPDQLLTGAGSGGAMRAAQKAEAEVNLPWLDTQAAFSHLRRLGDETTKAETEGTQDGGKTKQLVRDLGLAKTIDQAAQTAQQILLERMARVISISVSDIDTSKPVYAYGVDSLVAVELRNWLAMELKSELSIFDLTSNASIGDVSLKIAVRSLLVPAEVKSEKCE